MSIQKKESPFWSAEFNPKIAVIYWALVVISCAGACSSNSDSKERSGAGAQSGEGVSGQGVAASGGIPSTGGGGGMSGAAGNNPQAGADGGTAGTSATSGTGGLAGSGGIAGTVAGGGGAGSTGGASGAAGSGGGTSQTPDGGAGSTGSTLPQVDSVDTEGPFQTVQDLASGPTRTSGVFYPVELGKNGLKHPIFIWGCGGGSVPSRYVDHMNRIASHGFVAIADATTTAADGAPLKASLDWILGENDRQGSLFYQMLDTGKIAAGGHSIGSVNTFAIADDTRLSTTIHVAGGSLDGMGSGAARLRNPTAYICGETDMFGNVEKAEADYEATTVPVFMTVMTGAEHIGAAREGLGAIVAWLRWHLGGEEERRSMFLDPNGEFCTGKFVSKYKNW
ncbi:MAG: hypothetical protein JXA30_18140 [Deltaproteobacteria bacterium]|nr:hypothetical protein [Deltaproteobacteria bacterium]